MDRTSKANTSSGGSGSPAAGPPATKSSPHSPLPDGRAARTDTYWGLASPPLTSAKSAMRVRMRKQSSNRKLKLPSLAPDKIVGKILHFDKTRSAFKTNVMLCFRIAMGVLLAGVAQTRAPEDSNRTWYFLPSSYFLGGLSWAAVMTIFAASNHVGGAIMQIWQIDAGVALALLYNFVVFTLIPMNQKDLIQVPVNFNGTQYFISLQDWGRILPLILLFTLVVFISPVATNLKKFAVSTNLYFMLTVVSPMNPVYPTLRKDLGDGYYDLANLMKNFGFYCLVGIVGTLISLATMLIPYPLFAIHELQHHIKQAPGEVREIMNLIVDAYCFRARDIREMDFFRLKLGRLMESSRARLKAMEGLLEETWWEELVGAGLYFSFNKTIAKQFVHLYGRVIRDLGAMKFAIELETCPSTHTLLMNKLQRNIYLVQIETNDLLDEISAKVLSGAKVMPTTSFHNVEQNLSKILKKFAYLYGELLADDSIRTPGEVASSMPLNLFLYSFHTLVQTLCEFESSYNKKNYSTKHRVGGFFKRAWRPFLVKESYPIAVVIFSVRTTLGVAVGLCFSTFVFGFSSTVPNAIAMVADNYRGGTYGNTVNRISGLVAGTVMPSVFSFFICKSPSTAVYNTLNNIALFLWTMLSMYVYYSGSYIKNAGMVSAFMAASVFLEHTCRNQTGFKGLSYSSLTENSLGIVILIIVELVFRPRSARTLLRANIRTFLSDYGECLSKVYRHHLAVERGYNEQLEDVLDPEQGKELRKRIDGAFTKHLEHQAKLLQDASLEPELWRPIFSVEKYRNVLEVCENLLAHLRILVDLVEWHERRRNSEDLNLCQNSETGSFSMEVKALLEARSAWYSSQDDYAGAVSEALETLVMLFDEKFAQSDAEENALFMQMKEAFRLADVDRSGEVDPHELATLLDKLIPVAARGNVRMDQYVAEFMRLVDRNHDGKVSYAEFMDALNHGFRLELEIYEDMRGNRSPVLCESTLVSQSKNDDALPITEATEDSGASDSGEIYRHTDKKPPSTRSILDRIWGAPSSFLGALSGANSAKSKGHAEALSPLGDGLDTPPLLAGNGRRAMEAALLNVESFSIKEAAFELRNSYGKYLLLQTAERHVAVEDFIVMSCLICATDEIAARLTSLNTFAAT